MCEVGAHQIVAAIKKKLSSMLHFLQFFEKKKKVRSLCSVESTTQSPPSKFFILLTSWLIRHPCMELAPHDKNSLASSVECFSVIGSDRYAPIFFFFSSYFLCGKNEFTVHSKHRRQHTLNNYHEIDDTETHARLLKQNTHTLAIVTLAERERAPHKSGVVGIL